MFQFFTNIEMNFVKKGRKNIISSVEYTYGAVSLYKMNHKCC